MRVLALDGGGIRGLIPALVLAEIERRTGRAIRELVDLVAGTSTGAILACALTRPDPLPAARIAELYVEEGPRIFDRSLLKRITSVDGYLDERYDADGLRAVLERWLSGARLADADPAILLTVYDLERRRAVLLRRDDDLSMVDAAHASAAAPTYFEPVRAGGATLVDGGVFAINPAALAYAEVMGNSVSRSDPRKLGSPRDVTLVSLGTGALTRPLPYEAVRGWGRLEWAKPILDVVFDGIADAVDLGLDRLLGDVYVRFQTPLVEASDDLDDASEDNLAALTREAERLIAARDADIDRVCERLTA